MMKSIILMTIVLLACISTAQAQKFQPDGKGDPAQFQQFQPSGNVVPEESCDCLLAAKRKCGFTGRNLECRRAFCKNCPKPEVTTTRPIKPTLPAPEVCDCLLAAKRKCGFTGRNLECRRAFCKNCPKPEVATCKTDPVEYYLNLYPDVRKAGVDARRHWDTYGAKEGRKSCWPKPVSEEACPCLLAAKRKCGFTGRNLECRRAFCKNCPKPETTKKTTTTTRTTTAKPTEEVCPCLLAAKRKCGFTGRNLECRRKFCKSCPTPCPFKGPACIDPAFLEVESNCKYVITDDGDKTACPPRCPTYRKKCEKTTRATTTRNPCPCKKLSVKVCGSGLKGGKCRKNICNTCTAPTCATDPVEYYLMNCPDVRTAGVDARRHWNDFGWKEGRKSCWPAPTTTTKATTTTTTRRTTTRKPTTTTKKVTTTTAKPAPTECPFEMPACTDPATLKLAAGCRAIIIDDADLKACPPRCPTFKIKCPITTQQVTTAPATTCVGKKVVYDAAIALNDAKRDSSMRRCSVKTNVEDIPGCVERAISAHKDQEKNLVAPKCCLKDEDVDSIDTTAPVVVSSCDEQVAKFDKARQVRSAKFERKLLQCTQIKASQKFVRKCINRSISAWKKVEMSLTLPSCLKKCYARKRFVRFVIALVSQKYRALRKCFGARSVKKLTVSQCVKKTLAAFEEKRIKMVIPACAIKKCVKGYGVKIADWKVRRSLTLNQCKVLADVSDRKRCLRDCEIKFAKSKPRCAVSTKVLTAEKSKILIQARERAAGTEDETEATGFQSWHVAPIFGGLVVVAAIIIVGTSLRRKQAVPEGYSAF